MGGLAPAARGGEALAPAPDASVLAGPLVLTDGYGELRGQHFHAGLDYATSGVVGAAVRAPFAGHVERVRSSGAGYGRSVYLRTRVGALLVFGHLDAFAPAVAAYVDSAQRAAGDYEQDLWPAAGRFEFRAGDTLAWSGESGAGAPHLHLEVRRGDMALHPLRAGFALPDSQPPALETLVIEPLVAGRSRTVPLSAAVDTLDVHGPSRLWVRARDRIGRADTYAWSTSITWRGERVELRMDSISWAGEMRQVDWLVDHARATGSRSLLMWAPPGWRPRFMRATRDTSAEAGRIELARGERDTLVIEAEDAAGARVRRVVWLRGAEPPGPVVAGGGPWPAWLSLHAAGGRLDPGALGPPFTFEPGQSLVAAGTRLPARTPAPGAEWSIAPVPLAQDVTLRLPRLAEHVVVQRRAPGARSWETLDAHAAESGSEVRVRGFGTFRLLRDHSPPRIGTARRVTPGGRTPYSRWALEVPVRDEGSGLRARDLEMRVAGVRVPAEWDSEAGVLRWRPLAPPGRVERVEVVAVDRAGHRSRASWERVLDSDSRR